MTIVKLYTADGRHLCVAQLPPANLLPEVVMWGDRCFIPYPIGGSEGLYKEATTYRIAKAEVLA